MKTLPRPYHFFVFGVARSLPVTGEPSIKAAGSPAAGIKSPLRRQRLTLEKAGDAGSFQHHPGQEMDLKDGRSCSIGSFNEVAKTKRVVGIEVT